MQIYLFRHSKIFIEQHLCGRHWWGTEEYMVSMVNLTYVIREFTVILGGQTAEQLNWYIWYIGAIYDKEINADQVLLKQGEAS